MLKEWRSDDILVKMLKQHEGYSQKLYRCSAGYLTIGYGHNIEVKGLTKLQNELILLDDINDVVKELDTLIPWWREVNESSQRVLIDMGFMGVQKLLKFEKMLGLLRAKQYSAAASEIINSKYAKQVGSRAQDLYNMMR